MWFNSHCHLDFAAFDHDRAEVWARARGLGVHAAFVPGVEPAQWQRLPTQLQGLPGLCWGVGLHPYHLDRPRTTGPVAIAEWLRELEDLPRWFRRQGACAIGEFGLDGRLPKRGGPDLDVQARVAAVHLEVARTLRAPVVLHVVAAHGRMLELLERDGPLPAGGVLHSYSGSAELVKRYSALGLSFGVGGAVVSPRARRLRESLLQIEPARLLLETDAPDQPITSGPSRSSRNEPAALLQVAKTVAALLQVSEPDLARLTCDNACRLFAIESGSGEPRPPLDNGGSLG